MTQKVDIDCEKDLAEQFKRLTEKYNKLVKLLEDSREDVLTSSNNVTD